MDGSSVTFWQIFKRIVEHLIREGFCLSGVKGRIVSFSCAVCPRQVFKVARAMAPSVIYIDEAEKVRLPLKRRDSQRHFACLVQQ